MAETSSLRGGGGEISSFGKDVVVLYDELFGEEFDAEKIPSPGDLLHHGPLWQARQARFDEQNRKHDEAQRLGSRRVRWVHTNRIYGEKWLRGFGWQRKYIGETFYHDPRSRWYRGMNRRGARATIQHNRGRTWSSTGRRVMRRDKWSRGQRRRELLHKPRANVMVGSLRGGALDKEGHFATLWLYEQEAKAIFPQANSSQIRRAPHIPPSTPRSKQPQNGASRKQLAPQPQLPLSPPSSRGNSIASDAAFDPYLVWPRDAPHPPSYYDYFSPEYDHTGFFQRPVSPVELHERLAILPETGKFRRCEDGTIERVGEWKGRMEEVAAALRGGDLREDSDVDGSLSSDDSSHERGDNSSSASPSLSLTDSNHSDDEGEREKSPSLLLLPSLSCVTAATVVFTEEKEMEDISNVSAPEHGLSLMDFPAFSNLDVEEEPGIFRAAGLRLPLTTIFETSEPPTLSDLSIFSAPAMYSLSVSSASLSSFSTSSTFSDVDRGMWVAMPRRVVQLLVTETTKIFPRSLLDKGRGLLRLRGDGKMDVPRGMRFVLSKAGWMEVWGREKRVESLKRERRRRRGLDLEREVEERHSPRGAKQGAVQRTVRAAESQPTANRKTNALPISVAGRIRRRQSRAERESGDRSKVVDEEPFTRELLRDENRKPSCGEKRKRTLSGSEVRDREEKRWRQMARDAKWARNSVFGAKL